ncbi:MAG TPA: hypothetical protein VIM02_11335 [Rhizomicrobium sp.]
MTIHLKSIRSVILAAISLAYASSAIAQVDEGKGQRIPNHIHVSSQLKAAIATGDFVAKIAPRQGYIGQLMIGRLPDVQLKKGGFVPGDSYYPEDLGWYGGPVVTSASHINVYWGKPDGSVWGYPASYEYYLNLSVMSETLNRYTGNSLYSTGHYPVANWYWNNGNPGSLVYQSQIASLVQYMAGQDYTYRGARLGYTDIYHVFLPPGTDTCFDDPRNGCYNPDGRAPGPFTFCGYHYSTKLSNGTVVLYSVEPFESVYGCSTGTNTSNDTANVLGHEIAETVTDPIPGTAWKAQWHPDYGQEVGDVCSGQFFYHYLAGANYYTQDWYGNNYHQCVDGP